MSNIAMLKRAPNDEGLRNQRRIREKPTGTRRSSMSKYLSISACLGPIWWTLISGCGA